MTDALVEYYSRRAEEYEAVYRKPERQPDLRRLEARVASQFAGHNLLELACGTGYWTERYAANVNAALGVDASEEMLRIAGSKFESQGNIEFQHADVFSLPAFDRTFSACLCGFFWSHIPLGRLPRFLDGLQICLAPGAVAVFIDNRYVAESNTPISRTDSAGNTYQMRHLRDGSSHEVLKNFPTPEMLKAQLGKIAFHVEVDLLEYFWIATARLSHHPAEF